MAATFCIFTQGKTNQNSFMTATFCIFTHGKTNQTFNDSNTLHFYTKQKSTQIVNDFKKVIHVQTNTIQTIKNVKNQSLHVNKRI